MEKYKSNLILNLLNKIVISKKNNIRIILGNKFIINLYLDKSLKVKLPCIINNNIIEINLNTLNIKLFSILK